MQKASYESDLTDEQWQALESLLPKPKKTGRPPTGRRWVLNAILHVLRTGCQWTYLPKDFPPKSTVHGLFRSWIKNKIIESIHSRLRALARVAEGRRSRPTAGFLDSQTSHSAGLAEEPMSPEPFCDGRQAQARLPNFCDGSPTRTSRLLGHPAAPYTTNVGWPGSGTICKKKKTVSHAKLQLGSV